jgi:hypothetical protein
MQHAAFGVNLGKLKAASFGHAQAMPKHQQQKAFVAGFVPTALGGGHKLFDFGGNKVFSVVHQA